VLRLFPWLAIAACLVLVHPFSPAASQAVWADDDDDDDGDDEFQTLYIGGRLGMWFRPEINMDVAIGGNIGGAGLIPTEFDIENELGVTQNVVSDYPNLDVDDNAIPELEIILDSEWISINVLFVPPYEYRGRRTLTETINYAGQTYPASTDVLSSFRQSYGGLTFAINIFNNRYFRISPAVGMRILAIDWRLEDTAGMIKADTSDIDSPMQWGDFQVLPYPELGIDLRVGYRDYLEFNLKFFGSHIDYYQINGTMYHSELNVIFYPIANIGLQLGYRVVSWQVESETDNGDKLFDINMEFFGVTFGVMIRI
jgi:hypothetical protein